MAIYADIKVSLSERASNGDTAELIHGVVTAMRLENVQRFVCVRFREEASSGDYAHALNTARRWVTLV